MFSLAAYTPQKRWTILFSSENDPFFRLTKLDTRADYLQAPPCLLVEVYWLPVSHQVNSVVTGAF